MANDDWAFFLKQEWVVSAGNLLKTREEVSGIIGGKTIDIKPIANRSVDCYINGRSRKSVGSAESLVDFLIHIGEDLNHDQLIEEINSILDKYY